MPSDSAAQCGVTSGQKADERFRITTSEKIESLVVSKETEPVAYTINSLRSRNKLQPLMIFVIDMIPAENHVFISTTRIKHGEIDREGCLLEK